MNENEIDINNVDLVNVLKEVGFTDAQAAAIVIVSIIQSGRITKKVLDSITDNINANTVKVKNTNLN